MGQPPHDFELRALTKWRSTVFELKGGETFQLSEDAAGDDWEFTDAQLTAHFDNPIDEDFHVILVNVKLQDNWYVRRLSRNRVVFTFYEIADVLRLNNIPLRNVVLRVLYACTLLYRRYGDRIPPINEQINYAHDETRGCLFDMNASKFDVVYSCHKPIVCEYCIAELKRARVSNETIHAVRLEIVRVRRPLVQRVMEFVKHHPIWSVVISIATALIVGTISSALGTYLYEALKGRA